MWTFVIDIMHEEKNILLEIDRLWYFDSGSVILYFVIKIERNIISL